MNTLISTIKITILQILGTLSSIILTIGIGLIIRIEPFQEPLEIVYNNGTILACWILVCMAVAVFLASSVILTSIKNITVLDFAIYFGILGIAGLIFISRFDITQELQTIAYYVNGSILFIGIVCIIIHIRNVFMQKHTKQE